MTGRDARSGLLTDRQFIVAAAACTALLLCIGAVFSRVNPSLDVADTFRSVKTGPCQYKGIEDRKPIFDSCITKAGKAVVIFGDSHATDLFHALAYNLPGRHLIGISRGNCRLPDAPEPEKCAFDETLAFVKGNAQQIDAVIYTQIGRSLLKAGRPDRVQFNRVRDFLRRMSKTGIPVYWAGPQLEPNVHLDRLMQRPTETTQMSLLKQQIALSKLDAALARWSGGGTFTYVSKIHAQKRYRPGYLVVDGKLTYVDTTHWSAYGAALFGREFLGEPGMARIRSR